MVGEAKATESGTGLGRRFNIVNDLNLEAVGVRPIGDGEAVGDGTAKFLGTPPIFSDAGRRRREGAVVHSEGVDAGDGLNGSGFGTGCLSRDHAVFRFRGGYRWPSGA